MGISVQTTSAHTYPSNEYIPRGQNVLQALFKDHFAEGNCRDGGTREGRGVISGNTCGWNKTAAV